MSKPGARPALMPAATPDYMAHAWVDCLRWALDEDDVRQAFERDTSNTWTPARNALDRMIDEATGRDKAYIEAFVAWFNENVWGLDDVEDPNDR